MSCRSVLWSRVILLLLAAAVASCESLDTGRPGLFSGASVKVRGAGSIEVQDRLVEVFEAHGFQLVSSLGQHMTFEKDGSRNDRWKHSRFGNEPETQRLEVTLESDDDPETIRVHCSGKLVREPATGVGEETGYLPGNGRWRYGQYLREAKGRVEKEASRQ